MNKTIIAVYGRSGEGKSETIKNVIKIFEDRFAQAQVKYLIDQDDKLAIVTLGSIMIGIESQGDPNSRMINENTLEQLILSGCSIILCATRTEGMTVARVDELADKHDYHTLWKSSYYTSKLDYTSINMIAAEEIVDLIQSIISYRI
jgi:hypothetical protein